MGKRVWDQREKSWVLWSQGPGKDGQKVLSSGPSPSSSQSTVSTTRPEGVRHRIKRSHSTVLNGVTSGVKGEGFREKTQTSLP